MTATTPVRPLRWGSRPSAVSSCSIRSAVACSAMLSSGWRWKWRLSLRSHGRMSETAASRVAATTKLDTRRWLLQGRALAVCLVRGLAFVAPESPNTAESATAVCL